MAFSPLQQQTFSCLACGASSHECWNLAVAVKALSLKHLGNHFCLCVYVCVLHVVSHHCTAGKCLLHCRNARTCTGGLQSDAKSGVTAGCVSRTPSGKPYHVSCTLQASPSASLSLVLAPHASLHIITFLRASLHIITFLHASLIITFLRAGESRARGVQPLRQCACVTPSHESGDGVSEPGELLFLF